MTEDRPFVLVADDEEQAREFFGAWLEEAGYEVELAGDGDEALTAMGRRQPAVLIMDLKMPPGTWGGIETLKACRQRFPSLPVIVVSNKAETKRAIECVRLGAFDFVDKTEASAELPIVVGNALRMRQLEERTANLEAQNQLYREEEERRFGLGNIIGGSDAMLQVYRIIERVAPTEAAVLIHGETGTGKELVAGALHYLGPKKDGPFVKVNCAALPESLLEAELFGHEKGAFTGAAERRLGRFELAHNGTIFLDEIGDMSLTTQAKVLRVLQEKEFERVGGNRTVRVEVRVVSATNRDLHSMIQEGRFREDLYYRLNDLVVTLPPLRERREDIPLLARHFLAEFGEKYTGKRLAPRVEQVLMQYEWPGNVRELRKVLLNASIMAGSETIRFEDLPAAVLERTGHEKPVESLKDVVSGAVARAVSRAAGNRDEASRHLGITRDDLDDLIRRFGVPVAGE